MNDSQKTANPTKYLQLAKELAAAGYRLFSVDDTRKVIEEEQLEIKDIRSALHSLKLRGCIHSVKRGLYALDSAFLGGQPIHEFEIAIRLVVPSVISHYSSFHFHELTDQIPQIVFATIPKGTSIPRTKSEEFFNYRGIRYCYSQVKQEQFFGMEQVWVGEARIPIMDLERTLLDGLIKPKYCGGLREVLAAFSAAEFDVHKIIDYALRLDVSVAKRLGWVLESLEIQNEGIEALAKLPFEGFAKLDPSAKNTGPYNKRWQIQENF